MDQVSANNKCDSFRRYPSVLVSWDTDQWTNVYGEILLRDRREYFLLLRFGTEFAGRQNAEMFAQWQVVECDSHVLV